LVPVAEACVLVFVGDVMRCDQKTDTLIYFPYVTIPGGVSVVRHNQTAKEQQLSKIMGNEEMEQRRKEQG